MLVAKLLLVREIRDIRGSDCFRGAESMPVDRVAANAAEPAGRMENTGHPFILGTESDTLHVEGAAYTIRGKVDAMVRAA